MNVNKRLEKLEQAARPQGDLVVAVRHGEALMVNGVPTTQAHLDDLETQGHEILIFRIITSKDGL
jgi:hypothetical protein